MLADYVSPSTSTTNSSHLGGDNAGIQVEVRTYRQLTSSRAKKSSLANFSSSTSSLWMTRQDKAREGKSNQVKTRHKTHEDKKTNKKNSNVFTLNSCRMSLYNLRHKAKTNGSGEMFSENEIHLNYFFFFWHRNNLLSTGQVSARKASQEADVFPWNEALVSYLTAFSDVSEINLHKQPGGAGWQRVLCCAVLFCAPLCSPCSPLRPPVRALLWAATTPLLRLCRTHPRAHQRGGNRHFLDRATSQDVDFTATLNTLSAQEEARRQTNTASTDLSQHVVSLYCFYCMNCTVGFVASCSEERWSVDMADGTANFSHLSPCPSNTRPALINCI